MECIRCGLKLRDAGIDPASGRRDYEAAEGHQEGTLACEAHPAAHLYEENEGVPPHVPDIPPTADEMIAAILEGVDGYSPDGPDEPMGFTPWQATTLRDLLERCRVRFPGDR